MADGDDDPPKRNIPKPADGKSLGDGPRLREPRLTRAPSLSSPANDPPVNHRSDTGGRTPADSPTGEKQAATRPRLSAPPGGGLFAGRPPPPLRRPAPSVKHGDPSPGEKKTEPPADQKPKAPSFKAAPSLPPVPPPRELRPEPPPVPREDAKPAPRAHGLSPRPSSDFGNLPEPPRPKLRDSETKPETRRPDSVEMPVAPTKAPTEIRQSPKTEPTKPDAEKPVREEHVRKAPAAEKPTAEKSKAENPTEKPAARSTEAKGVSEPIPHPRARTSDAPRPANPPKPVLVAKNEGLEVHSLGKQFKKRPVLRDVSLRVQRGEAVGLLGPNGAGKTTCFYIVTGLISADYGQIVLDGIDITELPMYRRSRLGIGYLPQESSIFRGLTVEQNIMAVLELIEKNREKRETTLEALLGEFSISHLRRTPAIALSGGERRRLEIARALASQPNFILLDEPLAGIDPIAVRDIRELVSHLKDRGIGVLITDHNVRETLDIVDRAYILHDGSVLMEGSPDEIVSNREVRRVYLGDRFSL